MQQPVQTIAFKDNLKFGLSTKDAFYKAKKYIYVQWLKCSVAWMVALHSKRYENVLIPRIYDIILVGKKGLCWYD